MLFRSRVPGLVALVSAFALALGAGAGCKKEEKASASKEMVVVTKAGAEIDPAVPKSRIPDGAWICDMGTVHYARGEKGDGICPLCSMELVQKGAPKPEKAKPEEAAKPEAAKPDEAAKPESAGGIDAGAHGHAH